MCVVMQIKRESVSLIRWKIISFSLSLVCQSAYSLFCLRMRVCSFSSISTLFPSFFFSFTCTIRQTQVARHTLTKEKCGKMHIPGMEVNSSLFPLLFCQVALSLTVGFNFSLSFCSLSMFMPSQVKSRGRCLYLLPDFLSSSLFDR